MKKIESKLLKYILLAYILLCIVIAGLNFGMAPGSSPEVSGLIARIWHIYENQFKTVMLIISAYLTIRLLRREKDSRMRRQNIAAITVSAILLHVAGPLIAGTDELYFFSMPVPWSSYPLQMLAESSAFRLNFLSHWGAASLTPVLIFSAAYTLLLFAATLLFGRRVQCSFICMFNGFIAEVFAPVFPVFGRKRKAGRMYSSGLEMVLKVLRIFLLLLSLFFCIYWMIEIIMPGSLPQTSIIGKVETFKYLLIELFAAMFFWLVYNGRGYCRYCPLGTFLSILARAGGQKISAKSGCINCGRCNMTCPMGIGISEYAIEEKPVKSLSCVGCGHCIDACPENILKYTTDFMDFTGKVKSKEL